jgi:hypothetical protein
MKQLTEAEILEAAHKSNQDQQELVERVKKKRLVFGVDLDKPEPEDENYDPENQH